MDTKYDFGNEGENRIVYIRPVKVEDLPQDVQEQAQGEDTLYAVCSTDGEQLALVKDRKLAFLLARQHDFAPVAVH
ncbi:DUF1150 domain-containing protein [Thalassovita sp.]|uniref:DUF1150 domain-containing protein n=1 Tax=Thalassovita sp. TaxID=1979401 RepID=UPI0029DE5A6D|nr:DUF1150 domain-containing protein [Thalassovita sp.]